MRAPSGSPPSSIESANRQACGTLGDPPIGTTLGAGGDQAPEPAAMFGHPAVDPVGEPRGPRGRGRQRRSARQQSKQGRESRAGGMEPAFRVEQVPGGHPLGGWHPAQDPVALGGGDGDRPERPGAIPGEDLGEAPAAEATVLVVENGGRGHLLGIVPHVATTTMWEEIVDALNAVNGSHPGHRAVHAKGTVCSGKFTATPEAAKLSRAAHLQGKRIETTIRFSNASGNPHTSDANPIAGRGMSVKFHLADGDATDIVAVPLVVFIARTPEDFLELTRSRIPDPETGQPDPEKLGAYLGQHPETGIALQKGLPKIAPTTSYATSDYRALHAFGLVDSDGDVHWGRYSWEPEAGLEYLTDEQRDAAGRDYLQDEIRARLAEGIARFTLEFTLAEDGDPLDDPTAEWEGDREVVELGELEVIEVVEDAETPDRPLVMDPMRLTDGIEPSADPILAARPKAYAVSIERRTSSG
jgi:catalase